MGHRKEKLINLLPNRFHQARSSKETSISATTRGGTMLLSVTLARRIMLVIATPTRHKGHVSLVASQAT